MIICVTGSREYANLSLIRDTLYGLLNYPGRKEELTALYVGDARGVDKRAALEWKELTGLDAKTFSPDWKQYGRSAGILRNIQMIDQFKQDGGSLVLGFWNGSSTGTAQCLDYARRQGLIALEVIGFEDIQTNDNGTKKGTLKLKPWKPELTPTNFDQGQEPPLV